MNEKNYNSRISKWGLNLGLRIPIEIVRLHNFNDKEEVVIQSTSNGFKVIKVNQERADDFII